MAKAAWWVTEALRDRVSSVIAVTAGLGSGKTHGFCQWHYGRTLDNLGARFSAYMEPTYQKIHDTAIPTYQKVLIEAGLRKGRDYEVIKSPFPKLIFVDREPEHEVHFLSAEAPDKIAGVEYSHAVEDEAGINSKEARDNLRGRLYRDPKVNISQFLLGGAPQGLNDFAEEFDSDTIEDWDRSVDRDHFLRKLIEGVLIQKRRMTVWTYDNPFVRAEYIAQLWDTYGHNPALIKSYIYGIFCPFLLNGAYSNYYPQRHDLTEDVEPSPALDIYWGWDFNAAPLAWVTAQLVPSTEFGDRIHRLTAVHEASTESNNLDEAVIEFSQKFPVSRFAETAIVLVGDSTGHHASHKVTGTDYGNIRTYLRRLGYRNISIRAQTFNPSEPVTVEAVQKLLLSGYIRLCPRCRLLRKSLQATTWKKGVRKLDKPTGETWTHHSDAFKYLVYTEFRDFSGKPVQRVRGSNQ